MSNSPRDFILCRVGDLQIGIDMNCVQEVNRLVHATFIPGVAPSVKGLVNLRGSLVTVLDLGVLLHAAPLDVGPNSRNVIVAYDGERIGLMVDSVAGVVEVEGELESLPPHLTGTQTRWFAGLAQRDDGVMLILDFNTVLATDEELAIDT